MIASFPRRWRTTAHWPLAGLVLLGVPAGFAVAAGGRAVAGVTAAVALIGVCAAATLVPVGLRAAAVDVVVLIGLLAPVAVQEDRTSAQIASGPVTTLALAQGIVPAVCAGIALLLGPPRAAPSDRGGALARRLSDGRSGEHRLVCCTVGDTAEGAATRGRIRPDPALGSDVCPGGT